MNTKTVESWSDFLDFLEITRHHETNYYPRHTQFRGQSDYSWKISSSLHRIIEGDKISEGKANYYEKAAIQEFAMQAHLLREIAHNHGESPDYGLLIDMQHYTCPTRLVDWSGSPYIALYFAVRENVETDGALFYWNTAGYTKNMQSLSLNYDIRDPFNFTEYDFVKLYFPTKRNERIVRQQGCFSISNNLLKNHCDLIEGLGKTANSNSGLYKIRIPSSLKLEFLARLRAMNISANSLFPGIDGLGLSIQEHLKLRKWSGQ